MIGINYQNLFANNFNVVTFSLIGMSIVFFGLVFMAIYIKTLPSLLHLLHLEGYKQRRAQKKAAKGMAYTETLEELQGPMPHDPSVGTDLDHSDQEVLLAIATALHLHVGNSEHAQRITWDYSGQEESPWRTSGKTHSLSTRRNIPLRRL